MLNHRLIGGIVFLVCSLVAGTSAAFNFDQYKSGDMDELLSRQRPASGTEVVAPQKLNIEVTLVAYAANCDTGFLKQTMVMLGVPKEMVANIPISKCIKVKSSRGQIASMYIQDAVAGFLPEEVPLGSALHVFADLLFLDKDGPGMLVNEFQGKK